MAVKIGIIAGSGLDDPNILEHRNEVTVNTPFGLPSDNLITGKINDVECVILARHGRKHDIMPSNVNYRANVWAMKEMKCTHLIVSTACGSLRADIKPGDLVIPDDFIDRTTKRIQTFFDGEKNSPKGICHIPMYPAFCNRSRKILCDVAKELGYKVHDGATIVSIEGPRFSSLSESKMFQQWGADLINMTTCPEIVLAKEAGLLYSTIAMATDYDCWHTNSASVNVQNVLEIFAENVAKVKKLFINAIARIAKENWTEDLLLANEAFIRSIVAIP